MQAIPLRKPTGFDSFINQVEGNTPAQNENEKLGRDLVLNFVRNLNLFELAVGRKAENLEVKVSFVRRPGPLPPSSSPGRGCLRASSHVSILPPPLKLLPSLGKMAQAIYKNESQNAKQAITAEQLQLMEMLGNDVAELLYGGDAVSFGIASQGKTPMVYVVQQCARPFDLNAKVKQVVDSFTERCSRPIANRQSTCRRSAASAGLRSPG